MNVDLKPLLWPASRLGEALASLARESGFAVSVPAVQNLESFQWTADWMEAAAASLGLEAQPAETAYSDFDARLPNMGPALLYLPSESGFVALLPGSRALTPGHKKVHVDSSEIRAVLCAAFEGPAVEEIRQTLERASVPARKQPRALQAMLRERFSTKRIRGIWILRLPPGSNFWIQLRRAGVPRRLALLAAAHAVQYILWILAWWVIGANVLNGRMDPNYFVLWALLLVTLIPFRVLITWMEGLLAFAVGTRLKQRLLAGALRLDPDSIRHQGVGQLLGRVLESEAVEALALSGGFLAFVALIEIVVALFVLAAGAGGIVDSILLLLWLAIAAAIAWRYFQQNRVWTGTRLSMTHDLVENMAGHRTRIAQLSSDRWHEEEDEALSRYLEASKAMDKFTLALLAIIPRGWLIVALAGLAPALMYGAASPSRIAIAVGGMLLAYRALRRLVSGAWQLAGAAVAWERVAILFRAAARPELMASLQSQPAANAPVVDAHDLVFRYAERFEPVVNGCDLRIERGERVVLEGPSGGGKSTLVSLLAGLREPSAGRLVIDGVDRKNLTSQAWRRHIACAPQFHENHVLAETLAFNLFMGRTRALDAADFEEAQTVCEELGLGELLGRMPAGMLQMVGETGWQLSHGERSRLYIARALLQNAELVVLDESFAALDPENFERAVACVLKRSKSLLVIAHR